MILRIHKSYKIFQGLSMTYKRKNVIDNNLPTSCPYHVSTPLIKYINEMNAIKLTMIPDIM